MDREVYWKSFVESGNVLDYLAYRDCTWNEPKPEKVTKVNKQMGDYVYGTINGFNRDCAVGNAGGGL